MGVLACGANLFGQLIPKSDPILCCPINITHMKDAQTAHITFTHVFWKTEKCWKVFGCENSFLANVNNVDVKWKVSMSENKIAAINERNNIIILEEGKSWRSIHIQPVSQLEGEANSITDYLSENEEKKSNTLISRMPCKDEKLNKNIEITKNMDNNKENGSNQEMKSKLIKVLVDDKNLLALDEDGQLYSSCIHIPLPEIHIIDICIGAESYIALTKNCDVLTWGSGMRGQLGNGSLQACDEPQIVESLCGLGITQVAAGAWHCAALSESGDVYLWGWNESGQLGFPSKALQEKSQFPSHHHKCCCKKSETMPGCDNTVSQAATKDEFIEALKNNSLNLVNKERSIEVINVQTYPKLLDFWKEDVNIISVACGDRHTIFTLDDGSTWAVGMNKYGQLGIGDTCSRDSPVCIPVLGVEKVIAGAWNTLLFTKQ